MKITIGLPDDQVEEIRSLVAAGAAATADFVDAHVVVCAQRAGQPVITSDGTDLRRMAPGLPLFVV